MSAIAFKMKGVTIAKNIVASQQTEIEDEFN